MKHLFAVLFLVLTTQAVFAQTETPTTPAPEPAREATNAPKDPVLGPKQFELNRFSSQLQRMQTAYTAKDMSKVTAYYSGILMTMRNAMQDRRDHAVALPTAAQDLEKMQQIFNAFDGFVGFNKATPEEATPKFKLLADFQAILQSQFDALKAATTAH